MPSEGKEFVSLMIDPVLKATAQILIHAPDLVRYGAEPARLARANTDYEKLLSSHLRKFVDAVNYPPNQVYIGNLMPEELGRLQRPWFRHTETYSCRGAFGEIVGELTLYRTLAAADPFEFFFVDERLADETPEGEEVDTLSWQFAGQLKPRVLSAQEIKELIDKKGALPLFMSSRIAGCVLNGDPDDEALRAHVLLENAVCKATAAFALNYMFKRYEDVKGEEVDYILECSEEAIGDRYQRGGGNLAKAVGELAGCARATGVDVRGFCAGPVHALSLAGALVKAGIYQNVAVVGGGCLAKLGMNARNHIARDYPVLEDTLASLAALVSVDNQRDPVILTESISRHLVGDGTSPTAVMSRLVLSPVKALVRRLVDIDKYAPELHNPEITEAAGVGDIPRQNYRMIAALAVANKEIEKSEMDDFINRHGVPGFAPTQGHIPAGVAYLGHARETLLQGKAGKIMILGKGSLFLGRMTNLFDGMSLILQANPGSGYAYDGHYEATSMPFKKGAVALTLSGSEVPLESLIRGAELALRDEPGLDIVLIGPKTDTDLPCIETEDDLDRQNEIAEELYRKGLIGGVVTRHYNFPLGVTTVTIARVPGRTQPVLLAGSTGLSDPHRVAALVLNTIAGMALARALGIPEPTVGLLNIEGARSALKILNEMAKGGYPIVWARSIRLDEGSLMRGNDLLAGSADVFVCDSLTGNILTKLLASHATAGSVEVEGEGYGPGLGGESLPLVYIVSRASGSEVIARALKLTHRLSQIDLCGYWSREMELARRAGLDSILAGAKRGEEIKPAVPGGEVRSVSKIPVDEEISGIDVLEIDNAVALLMQEGIYAEPGMGCTGPVIRVNDKDFERAKRILFDKGFLLE